MTHTLYHGATLSSFTYIALEPLPLVAFSLSVPSRMTSALGAHVAPSPSLLPSPSPSLPPAPPARPDAHLIINILSAAQPHLAERTRRRRSLPPLQVRASPPSPTISPNRMTDKRGWGRHTASFVVTSQNVAHKMCSALSHPTSLTTMRNSSQHFGEL